MWDEVAVRTFEKMLLDAVVYTENSCGLDTTLNSSAEDIVLVMSRFGKSYRICFNNISPKVVTLHYLPGQRRIS